MALRCIMGAFLAALVMFVWGFVFWALSPVPAFAMKTLDIDPTTLMALDAAMPESAMYLYPGYGDESDPDFQTRHRTGPIFSVMYFAGGTEPMPPSVLMLGFLHFFFSALLAGFLLWMALPALPRYVQRVAFVALLGIFAGVFIRLSDPIWYYFPWKFAVVALLYVVVAWLLAGLVMGAVMRPASSAAK